ncbi:MAG: hypothetical protein ACRC8Y_25920 [Chroococcales cyanobacterium]
MTQEANVNTRRRISLTPEQVAQIDGLRQVIGAADLKETILRSVSVLTLLKQKVSSESQLLLQTPEGTVQFWIPELESQRTETWLYLVKRSHPWRQQLYLKGRKLLASTVWQDMIANGFSEEEASENWELPVAAIHEVIRYCETYRDLIALEAAEEGYRLANQGVAIEPKTTLG